MTNKKLDLLVLNEAHKEVTKTRSVDIPVQIEGETQIAVLEIDEVFTPSKISKCIEEFISRADALRKYNSNNLSETMEAFIIFMLIKHFTSFPAPSEYKDQVVVINMLADTGLLHRIYFEFNQTEVDKIRKSLELISEKLEENVEELLKAVEEKGLYKILELEE